MLAPGRSYNINVLLSYLYDEKYSDFPMTMVISDHFSITTVHSKSQKRNPLYTKIKIR